jgi:hypothetical protein
LKLSDIQALFAARDDSKKHPVPAPSQAPDLLDAIHAISHRSNDIGVNLGHARNHILNLMEDLNAGNVQAALFNADHAQKHMREVEKVAGKLAEHIASHPMLKDEYLRVNADNPFNAVIDPSQSQIAGTPRPPRY